MLNRFHHGSFGKEERSEVRMGIGEVIAQLDRFSVMRDRLHVLSFSGEGDPKSVMEESGAEMRRDVVVTAANQGALEMPNRVVEPAVVDIAEREIVIGEVIMRLDENCAFPQRLGVSPKRCLDPGE